jgi:transposase
VAQMDELFAVNAEARRKGLTIAARHIRRQETAKPLLDEIRSKIAAAQSIALPSSAFSRACKYALTLWKKLTRFLEHPELELSTNLAENSMRPMALGRKNWIHIGSPLAGPKVAAILSVVESCIWPRFFLDSLIARSSAFQNLLPLRGSPSIHTEPTGL